MRIIPALILAALLWPAAAMGADDTQFKKALARAEAGNAEAQVSVAEMYFLGRGVGRDPKAATLWFERAANAGSPHAQLNLARLLFEAQEHTKAAKWFRKAAAQGEVEAMTSLGAIHLRGLGVPRDGKAGIAWFSKAAALGDPQTQVELAIILIEGMADYPDPKAGLVWLRRAGLQGYGDALRRLAVYYSQDEPFGKDLVEAYRWLYLASRFGDEEAQLALERMSGLMSEGEIAEAKRRAAAWKPGGD